MVFEWFTYLLSVVSFNFQKVGLDLRISQALKETQLHIMVR